MLRAPMACAGATLSDEEVVARVLEGDVALYEVLMRRHNRRVYRAVRSILRDEAEVEDVMQDAYLAAFTHLGRFEGRARFSTWLVRIAVNRALERVRRAGRLVLIGSHEEQSDAPERGTRTGRVSAPPPDDRSDPESSSSARQLAALLAEAIDDLPPLYRGVYVLRELEGLSIEETARCLGVGAGAVKTRLHRARAHLRERLEARVGASAEHTFAFAGARCDRMVEAVMAGIGVFRSPRRPA